VFVGVNAQKIVYVAALSTEALVKICPAASFMRNVNEPAIDAVVPVMKPDIVVPYVMLFVEDIVIVGVAFCTVIVFVPLLDLKFPVFDDVNAQ
jgi:hypothetical protein